MMIKANGEYLDFNGDIEIESQIKLFEDLNTSNGDFSYDIQLQDNSFNRKILGIPRADTVKSIYQEIPSEVVDDTGQSVYVGKLQVNRVSGGFISSTFFGGNNEWFSQLSDPLSDLPLYRYDVDLDENGIFPSWFVDTGIVFPILDTGALITRGNTNLVIEDFVPCFYVKTLMHEIFDPKGIKLEGDFINDPIYNKLIVASNGRSQTDINNRSSYVEKTTVQNNITSLTKVTFQNDSVFPFYDGSLNNFSNSTYTADVKMNVQVNISLVIDIDAPGSPFAALAQIHFYKNGVSYYNYGDGASFNPQTITSSRTINIPMEAGDTIEIYADEPVNAGGNIDINSGTIKITPTFVYRVFGTSSVPKWTQIEFVSNILRIFNVLPSYNWTSKTLTLDLFNNIKNKPYVDVSQEIVISTVDFSEFVSDYAKNNYFKYQESDDEDLRKYNISNFISYGSGNLTIDNDYIENSKDIVESDFTAPITYLNGVFDMSMERFHFVELEELDDKSITSVTDASLSPRFNISNADDLFTAGDVVRIETDVDSYNGDWVVNAVTSTYITVHDLSFDVSATGTATLVRHKFTTDDSVYLFVNIPNVDIGDISSKRGVTIGDSNTILTTVGTAYFNLLNNNRPINREYKQSLSFGGVNNPLDYQLSILDTYWPLFSRILNSPVSVIGSGYLKKTTFDKVKSFLRPVRIETEETSNLYYINRNRGYKGSERPCELELIKLN